MPSDQWRAQSHWHKILWGGKERTQREKREKRKGKGRRSACQRCRDPYLLSSASTSKKRMFDKCYTVWVLGLLEHATSPVAQMVKNLPAMQETWVRSLGWEDTLEKEMATYSKILALRIPWTEEPHGSQSRGSQRVRHDWATNSFTTEILLSL